MPRKVNVIGVGMVPFAKPGKSEEYHVMATKAGTAALADAKVPFDQVQQAYAGYVYGDSTCGQRAVYQLGLTGIPVFNVNNNCSTGSTALFLARQAIESGAADCVLALGFDERFIRTWEYYLALSEAGFATGISQDQQIVLVKARGLG